MTSTTNERWWLDAVEAKASIASMIRCIAESAPIVLSVPTMSLSMEPTAPAMISCVCALGLLGADLPVATSSSSRPGHSERKMSVPVSDPSPPITTSRSIPRSTRLRAARSRP